MSQERRFAADWSAWRGMSRRSMAIRFGFGALLSVVAGGVGLAAGPLVGGAFLAFPAILPATLSLLEKDDGERAARDDDDGALLGSLALIGFAVVAWKLLPSGALIALLAASAAWLAAALVFYVASHALKRRERRPARK